MLPCPHCKHLVSPQEHFCAACSIALRHEPPDRLVPVFPRLEPGAVLAAADFRVSPLPGHTVRSYRFDATSWYEPHPAGILFTITEPKSITCPNIELRVRDACVRARFTLLDPGARIGLVARRSALSDARIGYAVDVGAERQSVWLRRVFDSSAYADTETLANIVAPAVKPVGVTTVIELRALGPTLQVVVDGVPVSTVHDPVYGIGNFGVRIARDSAATGPHPTRVVCHGYDICEVAR